MVEFNHEIDARAFSVENMLVVAHGVCACELEHAELTVRCVTDNRGDGIRSFVHELRILIIKQW